MARTIIRNGEDSTTESYDCMYLSAVLSVSTSSISLNRQCRDASGIARLSSESSSHACGDLTVHPTSLAVSPSHDTQAKLV